MNGVHSRNVVLAEHKAQAAHGSVERRPMQVQSLCVGDFGLNAQQPAALCVCLRKFENLPSRNTVQLARNHLDDGRC